MTYSVLTRASAALALASALAVQGTGPVLAQPHRHDSHRPPPYHYGYAPSNGGVAIAGALLGLGVGAVVGGALAASAAPPPPAYYPAPPPPAYYSAPPPAYYGYGY